MSHKVDWQPADARFGIDDDAIEPDVIVLNAGSGRRALSRLLPEMRDETHLRPAPVMVFYPMERPDLAIHALAIGADQVVVDCAGVEEIALRIASLVIRKLRRDALRQSDEQSDEMAMTDDEVLRQMARRPGENLGAFGLVARYGGEESLITLPDTSAQMAASMAERVRRAVSLESREVRPGLKIGVTVSLGVAAGSVQASGLATRTGTSGTTEAHMATQVFSVFDAADAARDQAKFKGRNRVEVSGA